MKTDPDGARNWKCLLTYSAGSWSWLLFKSTALSISRHAAFLRIVQRADIRVKIFLPILYLLWALQCLQRMEQVGWRPQRTFHESITCLLHSPSSFLLLPEIKSSLRWKISTYGLCHLSRISAFEFSSSYFRPNPIWLDISKPFQKLSRLCLFSFSLHFICKQMTYDLDLWPSWISHANPEIQQYIHFTRFSL